MPNQKPELERERSGDDVLTARDLVRDYGLAPRVAESIVRSLLRQGKGVALPIRRRAVLRKDVFPERDGVPIYEAPEGAGREAS